MKHRFARPSRKGHTGHTKSHPGVYNKEKDIAPCPNKVYMSMTWNMPIPYANALQEKYPGMTLAAAIKIHVTSTLTPVESKSVDTTL